MVKTETSGQTVYYAVANYPITSFHFFSCFGLVMKELTSTNIKMNKTSHMGGQSLNNAQPHQYSQLSHQIISAYWQMAFCEDFHSRSQRNIAIGKSETKTCLQVKRGSLQMETNSAASTSGHISLSHSLAFDLKQVWQLQRKKYFFFHCCWAGVNHKFELSIEHLVHYILEP